MYHQLTGTKFWFAAIALLVLPFGAARAQTYDTFEVLRLSDRTIYIFPKGYAPNIAVPFAPVVNPWYYPPVAPPAVTTAAITPLSYTYGSESVQAPAATSLTLRVPPNAEVWIQGKKMDEKGTERRFAFPSSDSRLSQDYEVRVTWQENGRNVSNTSRLNIRPGDQQSITFVAALTAKKPASTEAARSQ